MDFNFEENDDILAKLGDMYHNNGFLSKDDKSAIRYAYNYINFVEFLTDFLEERIDKVDEDFPDMDECSKTGYSIGIQCVLDVLTGQDTTIAFNKDIPLYNNFVDNDPETIDYLDDAEYDDNEDTGEDDV